MPETEKSEEEKKDTIPPSGLGKFPEEKCSTTCCEEPLFLKGVMEEKSTPMRVTPCDCLDLAHPDQLERR